VSEKSLADTDADAEEEEAESLERVLLSCGDAEKTGAGGVVSARAREIETEIERGPIISTRVGSSPLKLLRLSSSILAWRVFLGSGGSLQSSNRCSSSPSLSRLP
jgi:hypothetical protein